MSGLRERKKARTRTEIQQQALRLFREQGFHATTVEQVAEAAEVSPSTVFRYFPTKDDLAVLDDHLPLAAAITRAFEAQPADVPVMRALRVALRSAFEDLRPDERGARVERDVALLQVPELWTANVSLIVRGVGTLGELVARRTGRDPRDPAVLAVSGAVAGVCARALLDAARRPGTDVVAALDDAMALLEAGLPV
jgi:AcrR family transcriptional regulator